MSDERRGPLPLTSLWVDIERQCRDVSPDRKHECTIERGHAGAHIAIDPIFNSPMAVETLVGFLDEAHGETIVAMLNETSESRANGNREHTASEKEKKEHSASEKEKKA